MQLLADDFARNGFKTVAIDMFDGDPAPENALETGNFNRLEFLKKHGPLFSQPIVDRVIAALKEAGVKRFGSTGYCYGGRIAFNLAFEDVTCVTVVSHPSWLQAPVDLEVICIISLSVSYGTDVTLISHRNTIKRKSLS